MTATKRLGRMLNLLELTAAMNDDSDALQIHLVDIAAVALQALVRHQGAEQAYLTPQQRSEWAVAFLAKLERASGLRFPDPPAEPDAGDQRFDQLENLWNLLVRACFAADPSASEIRRLVATQIRVERQLQAELFARRIYLDRDGMDEWADQFTESLIAFSKEHVGQDAWNRIVDEVIGADG